VAGGQPCGDLTDGPYLDAATGLTYIVTGATTPLLQISDVHFGNHARNLAFAARVSNSCMTVTSTAATLTLCLADFDDGSGTGHCDQGVTIDDLLYYLDLFAASDIRADLDNGSNTGTPDGGVTIDDLLFFLVRFQEGC